MALALNTSHPLYSSLVALICVDDDNVIKDLKGDTCTPHANVTLGTGTYGRHFRTPLNGNFSYGVALTNGHVTKPTANPVGTTVVVFNVANGYVSRGVLTNGQVTNAQGPAFYTGDVAAAHPGGAGNPATLGTTDVIGTGAHMMAVGWSGTSSHFVYVDGAMEAAPSTNLGNANDSYKTTYIGGSPSVSFGAADASIVWYAHFRKYLTEAELDELFASLGASNSFALVNAGAGITGTASQTLDPITQTAAGTVVSGITGSASQALDPITQAAEGTVTGAGAISGAASQTLDAISQAAAGAVTTPRIVLGPFANNTGLLSGVLANHPVAHAVVMRASDRAQILSLAGLSTDSNGYLTLASTSLAVGTAYMGAAWNADGSAAGIKRAVAVAS